MWLSRGNGVNGSEDSLPPGTLQPGMGLTNGRVRSARLGDEIIVARSFGSLRSGVYAFWLALWGADLVAVDPASRTARSVLSLVESLGDPTGYLEQTNGFPPFPLWFRLWAVCGNERVVVHDRMRNEIRVFSPRGTEMAPIALPAPRFESVTDQQFARAVFELRAAEVAGVVGARLAEADSIRAFNEMVAEVQGTPERLARFLPRYVDLRCADDGAVWLQPIDLERGNLMGGRLWLRIGNDGAVREAHLPSGFDAYRFTGGRVWGVQRDALDVASIGWIALPTGP